MFEIDINSIEWYAWVLCALFLFSFLVQLFYYLYFYGGVLSWKAKVEKNKVNFSDKKPGVSVIICAQNESDFIRKFLPSILNQNYPDFQVVVVNVGSTDETDDELNYLSMHYRQLYSTFIPMDVQVVSPKKLALTVGVKAALHDILLFTDTDCEPVSDNWLSEMVSNFVDNKDFVLGYVSMKPQKGFIGKLIAYDNFFNGLQYLGFALRGKPYMCASKNIAYRKKFFFDRKGFASLLHLRLGDSELLVNKDASKLNTRVAIASDSVIVSNEIDSFSAWCVQKEYSKIIAKQYTGIGKWLKNIEYLTRALFYLSFVAVCAVLPLLFVLIAVFIFALRYTTQALVLNLTGKQLKEQKYYASVFLFDILLPILSCSVFFRIKLSRKGKYVS